MSRKVLPKLTTTCATKGGKTHPPQHVQRWEQHPKNNVENGVPEDTRENPKDRQKHTRPNQRK